MNATPQYVILADLMSIGYSEIDAYTIAYPENEALSAKQNKGIRENILSSAKFKKVFEERCSHIKSGVAMPIPVEEVELVGTEEVMKEILRSAKQQPVGSVVNCFQMCIFARGKTTFPWLYRIYPSQPERAKDG